jgi:uncharacterized membrane protein YgcG
MTTRTLLDAPTAAALVAELLDGSSSADVQLQRCESLLQYSGLTAEAPASALAGALIRVMQRHSSNARLQMFACSALGKALAPDRADSAAVCATAVDAGAIEAVVAALRSHAAYHQIQFVALGALLLLMALDPVRQARAAAAGATAAAVNALKRHADVSEVVCYACNLLANTTCNDAKNAAKAGAAGAIQAVVAAMGNHPQDQNVQRLACSALHNLTFGFDDREQRTNHQMALDAGAGAAILHAVRSFTDDVVLQRMGCSALAHMYVGLDATCDTRLLALTADGAVQAVVTLSSRFPADADAQHSACEALRHLSRSSNVADLEDGVAGVVAAIGAHRGDVKLLKECCVALADMCSGGANITYDRVVMQVGAAGAVEALAAVMRAHPLEARLQQEACTAISNMTAANLRNGAKAGAAGAVEAAVAAMRAFPDDVHMQQAACTTLTNLTQADDSNAARAGAAGAVEAAARALRAHPADAKLQARACNALGNMSQSNTAGNAAKAVAAGVIEAALTAMRAFGADGAVQRAGCRVLGNVCYESGVQLHTRDRRAYVAVMAAIRAQLDDAIARRSGCFALASIARTEEGRRCVIASSGFEALVAVLRAHLLADGPRALRDGFGIGCVALEALLDDSSTEERRRAVCAGVLEVLQEGASDGERLLFEDLRLHIVAALQDAPRQHDARPCSAAACARCGAMRARGAMCALPCCGAQRRAGDGGAGASGGGGGGGGGGGVKKLLRCGTCRGAMYCCAAHQREDWARHKKDCRAATATTVGSGDD